MRLSKESSIGFIGAGKVGTSLAIALHKAGYNVTGSNSKSISSANNFSIVFGGNSKVLPGNFLNLFEAIILLPLCPLILQNQL